MTTRTAATATMTQAPTVTMICCGNFSTPVAFPTVHTGCVWRLSSNRTLRLQRQLRLTRHHHHHHHHRRHHHPIRQLIRRRHHPNTMNIVNTYWRLGRPVWHCHNLNQHRYFRIISITWKQSLTMMIMTMTKSMNHSRLRYLTNCYLTKRLKLPHIHYDDMNDPYWMHVPRSNKEGSSLSIDQRKRNVNITRKKESMEFDFTTFQL